MIIIPVFFSEIKTLMGYMLLPPEKVQYIPKGEFFQQKLNSSFLSTFAENIRSMFKKDKKSYSHQPQNNQHFGIKKIDMLH